MKRVPGKLTPKRLKIDAYKIRSLFGGRQNLNYRQYTIYSVFNMFNTTSDAIYSVLLKCIHISAGVIRKRKINLRIQSSKVKVNIFLQKTS